MESHVVGCDRRDCLGVLFVDRELQKNIRFGLHADQACGICRLPDHHCHYTPKNDGQRTPQKWRRLTTGRMRQRCISGVLQRERHDGNRHPAGQLDDHPRERFHPNRQPGAVRGLSDLPGLPVRRTSCRISVGLRSISAGRQRQYGHSRRENKDRLLWQDCSV